MKGIFCMSEKQIEKAINNAVFSTEMEGYTVDDTAKELCRKLLKKKSLWKNIFHL